MSWKNLDYCVHLVLSELESPTTKDYERFLQFGYRAWRELNIGLIPTIKATTLEVADNLTAPFPSDFIFHTAIGVCIGDRMYPLTLNDNLCLDRELDDCCEPVAVDTNNCKSLTGGYWFFPSWRNNKYVGENYGLSGGYNFAGYYRLDWALSRFQFANLNSGMKIILEYKATGIDCNGEVCVPEEAVESIVSYIHWKRIQNNPNFSLGEKDRARQDYFIQYEKTKMFLSSFTVDEFLDELYSSIKSSPKR